MDADAVAEAIDRELRAGGTPERAEGEKRYLKSELEFVGANMPTIRRVTSSALRAHPGLDRDELVALADALWRVPLFERRMAAVVALRRRATLLKPRDIALVERLIRQAKTWALVDPLASDIAGDLVARHPELDAVLDKWAGDADFWIRRSALLALLIPLRRGGGDFERFGRYADAMLEEREFFVRKAIGWVLREVAKSRPGLVYAWLAGRTDRVSGVTVREAVKYLDAEQRARLMSAYRDRRAATS